MATSAAARAARSAALVAALVAAPLAPARADLPRPEARLELAPEGRAVFGRPARATIVVTHAPGDRLTGARTPESAPLTIRALGVPTARGDAESAIEAELTAWRTGQVATDAIAVTLVRGTQTLSIPVASDPIEVAHGSSDAEAPGPALGPLSMRRPGLAPWIALGALGAALLIALAAWRLAARRRADREQAPPLDPWDEALADLDALSAPGVLGEQGPRRFAARISAVVRRYLGRRYGFPGPEWTTTEVAARLERAAPKERAAARALLRRADRTKFAGAPLTEADADQLIAQARALIERTRPSPAPDQSPSAPRKEAA